jgi:hypothetical protein
MSPIYFSKASNRDATNKCDTYGELDHEQHVHILKKIDQSDLQSHMKQNNVIKNSHTPYLKVY